MKKRLAVLFLGAALFAGYLATAQETADNGNALSVGGTVAPTADENNATDESNLTTDGKNLTVVLTESDGNTDATNTDATPETPTKPEEPAKPDPATEPEEPAKPDSATEPEEPAKPETATEPEEPAKPETQTSKLQDEIEAVLVKILEVACSESKPTEEVPTEEVPTDVVVSEVPTITEGAPIANVSPDDEAEPTADLFSLCEQYSELKKKVSEEQKVDENLINFGALLNNSI